MGASSSVSLKSAGHGVRITVLDRIVGVQPLDISDESLKASLDDLHLLLHDASAEQASDYIESCCAKLGRV